MSNVIVIISDLHVGAGPLDDCDEELEAALVSFLDHLCSRTPDTELIINGDFLDFVQAEPWSGAELEGTSPLGTPLCFTQEQSVAKLEAITTKHATIFTGLGSFLARKSENRLVINPGNHDVDFFWPDVRTLFVEKVLRGSSATRGQIYFNLQQVYMPERLPNIWIEHGHQYDPVNWFYVDEYDELVGVRAGRKLYWSEQDPPIFKDQGGKERLFECLGTRFLIKFLNWLDADYPFVDNVKPYSRFLRIFGVSAFVRGYGPVKAALAVWRMLFYLGGASVTDPGGLLAAHDAEITPLALLLSEELKNLSKTRRILLHKEIRARGFDLEQPALMYLEDAELCKPLLLFLSENLDLLNDLPGKSVSYLEHTKSVEADGYLTLAKGYNVDETKELKRAATRIIQEHGASMVIMGHTHEPVNRSTQLPYINTGSWTHNYDLREERIRPWEVLRSGSNKLFPYELNYVEIMSGIPESVRMRTYENRL